MFDSTAPGGDATIGIPSSVTVASLQSLNPNTIWISGAGPFIFSDELQGAAPSIFLDAGGHGQIVFDTLVQFSGTEHIIAVEQEHNDVIFEQSLGATSANLTKTGAGELQFWEDNSNWTGTITVETGAVVFERSAAASAIVAGGELRLNFSNSSSYLGDITLQSGTLRGTSLDPRVTGTLIADVGNTAFIQPGGTMELAGGSTGDGRLAFQGSGTVNVVDTPFAHQGGLYFEGTQFNLLVASNHSGGTHLNGGTLTVDPSASLVGTGDITVDAGLLVVTEAAGASQANNSVDLNSVRLQGGGLVLRANLDPSTILHATSTGGSISLDGVADFDAAGTHLLDLDTIVGGEPIRIGARSASSLAASLEILPNSTDHTLRFGGEIAELTVASLIADDNGAPTLVDVDGVATTRFSGANTYTGLTTISSGTVHVDHASGLGSAASGTVITGGQLRINVASQEPIEVHSNAELRLLIADPSSGDLTLLGGEVIMEDGASTYGGAITMSGGLLQIPSDESFSAPIMLDGGDSQVLAYSAALANFVTGSGDLTLTAENSGLDLDGTLNFNGNLTLDGNEIRVNALNAYDGETTIIRGSVTLNNQFGFGFSSHPIRLQGGDLILNATPSQDITLVDGTVYFASSATPFNGDLTFAGATGDNASIDGDGIFNGDIILESVGNAVIRAGEFRGEIRGSAPLLIVANTTQPIALDGASTYTGITTITGLSRVDVNNAFSLGSSDAGTVVDEGTLDVNVSTNEPLMLVGPGTINLFAPTPQLPIMVAGSQGTVAVYAGGTFDNVVNLFDTRLEIRDDVAIGGISVRGDDGELIIGSASSLTISTGELEIHSGMVNGNISGDSHIRKQSAGIGELVNIGDFEGVIDIERGHLKLRGGDSTPAVHGTVSVNSTHSAALILTNAGDYYEEIELNNAHGYMFAGGLRTDNSTAILHGELNLGDVGATVGQGSSGGVMIIHGPITGGALTTVGDNFRIEIAGGNHTYSGATNVRDGNFWLHSDGALHSTSRINIHHDARFSIDNDTGANQPNRIGDSTPVFMDGGELLLDNPIDAHASETIGELSFVGGHSLVSSFRGTIGDNLTSELTVASVSRDFGATARFYVTDDLKISVASAPTLENGIIGGWAIASPGQTGARQFATIGTNGIEPLSTFQTDITTATATDNVRLAGSTTLTQNTSVNSLSIDAGATLLDLGGFRLTVESGGVIANNITNGQVTAGSMPDAELFFHSAGLVDADIVDNAAGPVSVVVEGGVRLQGDNSYTGATVINDAEVLLLSENALPENTDVIINGGELTLWNESSLPRTMGKLVVKNGGEFNRFNPLSSSEFSFSEVELHDGTVSIPLVGDGLIRKVSKGVAIIGGSVNEFPGDVIVDDGVLVTNNSLMTATYTVNGGVLDSASQLDNPIILAGGALWMNATGTVDVVAYSTILAGLRNITGAIRGTADLNIEAADTGTGEAAVVRFGGDNSDYHGDIAIHSGILRVQSISSLGTGSVVVHSGGRLDVDNGTLPNGITLNDGSLYASGTSAIVAGAVTINGGAYVGGRLDHNNVEFSGDVHFVGDAQLNKVGDADLIVSGDIFIDGQAAVTVPSGLFRASGTLNSTQAGSALNIIGLGFHELDLSVQAPEGTSLLVQENGATVTLQVAGDGSSAGGSGRLIYSRCRVWIVAGQFGKHFS